jgi:hypothetical protein
LISDCEGPWSRSARLCLWSSQGVATTSAACRPTPRPWLR